MSAFSYILTCGGNVTMPQANIPIFATDDTMAREAATRYAETLSKAGYHRFWLSAHVEQGKCVGSIVQEHLIREVGTFSVKQPEPVATFSPYLPGDKK